VDFIHTREYLTEGDIVVVWCSHQCNVCLMDDTNFSYYRSRGQFRHYGGHCRYFPVRIPVPSTGYWNVTLDLGGGSASIRHSISFIRNAA
jgi:hypothetical protein